MPAGGVLGQEKANVCAIEIGYAVAARNFGDVIECVECRIEVSAHC